jgi:hypothetical protein
MNFLSIGYGGHGGQGGLGGALDTNNIVIVKYFVQAGRHKTKYRPWLNVTYTQPALNTAVTTYTTYV